MVGSPTVFADAAVEAAHREALETTRHGLYIPSGALWGATDLNKMGQRGTLTALKVTMKKHPDSLKLFGDIFEKNEVAKASGPPTAELIPRHIPSSFRPTWQRYSIC